MENKRFEIKGFKDHRKFARTGYLLGIFLFSFIIYGDYDEGQFGSTNLLFLAFVVLYTLRLFFPQICFAKVYIAFMNGKIFYKIGDFVFKQREVSIPDIQDIKIFESAIFVKRRDSEVKISLIPFSDELKQKIRQSFEELQQELKESHNE